MSELVELSTPKTTTDLVFEHLHDEIVSLKLLPGAKLSEADVAARLGVSRQPVRDAFNRLGNLDLLSIRPQRATRVCGFSKNKIANARFVRLAVELEVVRQACAIWNSNCATELDAVVSRQRMAINAGDVATFHELDYDFHKLICDLGDHPLAFETIVQCKQQVDRLCVLSLGRPQEVKAILADHEAIADALREGAVNDLEEAVRRHLARLDETIFEIERTHSDYFE